jgi:hypothetical protein
MKDWTSDNNFKNKIVPKDISDIFDVVVVI